MFFFLLVFVSARSTQIWLHEDETILKHKKGKHYNDVLVWEQRCRHRDTNDMTAVRDISSRYMQAFQSNRTFYGHTIKYNGNKASIEFHRRIEIKTIGKINRNGKKHTALFNSISLHCIHVFASLKFFFSVAFFQMFRWHVFYSRSFLVLFSLGMLSVISLRYFVICLRIASVAVFQMRSLRHGLFSTIQVALRICKQKNTLYLHNH